MLRSSKSGLITSGLSAKILYTFFIIYMRDTCPAHQILITLLKPQFTKFFKTTLIGIPACGLMKLRSLSCSSTTFDFEFLQLSAPKYCN
jgi:hypothetical protein